MKTARPIRRLQGGGFSLLETIAALLLLALAFGAVMHVAGAAMQLTGHARDLSRVGMWADTTMDALGASVPVRPGTQEGWYDKRYRWRMQVVPQPVSSDGGESDIRLYRVDLDIYWQDGSAERRAHFATLRLQDEPKPAPSSSAGNV